MRHHSALFIPGPTNVPEAVRRAMDLPMEDMRAPDFPAFTLPLLHDLKQVFRTEAGTVLIFPGSGTGGWEAALTNTLSPGDRVLAARIGQFSHLWIEMCHRLGLEVEEVDVEWGEGVPVERFAAILADDKSHRIKAVLVTHNETATGVTSDVAGVRAGLDAVNHPALLFVDGVSSIASIDFRMDDWGVDIAVTGSQKGFMLPTGLAILAVSPRALEAARTASSRRCYFDFATMAKANQDGYFPYTPATTLLRGLRASVDLLLEEGLDQVSARHHRLAGAVRSGVAAWGLKLCAKAPRWHSDTVSAIMVPPQVDGTKLAHHAYRRYGLSLGIGLNKVAGRMFRIGHLGALSELMILQALAGAEMALKDFDVPITLGSGVAAAQARFCEPTAEQRAAA
jgi:alanine-glyoxylate transaminase/serine-glyoxylate transaminase/serine-pyruvate transaminase